MKSIAKTNLFALIGVAAAAMLALTYATPASAFYFGGGNSGDDNDITVEVNNSAYVSNTVEVEAETGDNDADGGDGEEGGNGGDAEGDGNNNGGEGGEGGTGGDGGIIVTGDATAYASLLNEVNVNKTKVQDSCGCPEDEGPSYPWLHFGHNNRDNGDDNDIKVDLTNYANVGNTVEVEAETGDNDADGGDGEEGGNGGDAKGGDDEENGHHYFFWWSQDNDDEDENNGGDGGAGGDAGWGGVITTGDAASIADVVNVVNRNVTRVTRQ